MRRKNASTHIKSPPDGTGRCYYLVKEQSRICEITQVTTIHNYACHLHVRFRAPELLYGARKYDEGVDLWAVGCIFGELLNNSPLFPGENDIEQLCCVLRVLGTPTEESWPGMTELPDYNKITFPENPPIPFEEIMPDASPEAIDLVRQFLVYPSKKRISAKKALIHPYFFTGDLREEGIVCEI